MIKSFRHKGLRRFFETGSTSGIQASHAKRLRMLLVALETAQTIDDMDIPGLVEYSNLRALGDQHVVYVPFYMPGEHPKYAEPDSVFLDKVRRYLQAINPALQDADFMELRASRYRFAQPICPPNYLDGLPPMELPIQGLWVADTSYYYPEDRGISESIGFGRMMAQKAAAA